MSNEIKMSDEIKLSDILLRAVEVVISRNGDTGTEDGDFACVDIDSIIHLEYELSKFFTLDSDDVITSDVPLIKVRAEKYDRLTEENKRLREAVIAALKFSEEMHYQSQSVTINESIKLNKDLKQLLSELGGE